MPNESAEITRIPIDTYMLLKPDVIILLTEKAEIIADRRLQRDNVSRCFRDNSVSARGRMLCERNCRTAKCFVSGVTRDE